MAKHKFKDEAYIFLPARRHIAILSFIVAIFIMVNIYAIVLYNSIIYKISLVLLIILFTFFFVPVVRNQRVIISGDMIGVSIYGKWYSLSFNNDLCAVLREHDVIVSYRFNCNGQYYQISPSSYYESEELRNIFLSLSKNKIATAKTITN